jgi:hypothetical protein
MFFTMECTLACHSSSSGQLPIIPTNNMPMPSLNKSQWLLQKWHERLSHMNFSKLQDLARAGRLPKQIAECDHPIWHHCQFGKAHRRPATSAHKARPIDAEDLQPGDRVSVNQIESPAPGMVDISLGKPTSAKYHAASLYTDHASQYMCLKCHYLTGGAEAVAGKQKFEQLAASFGIKIKAYRANNGIMSKRELLQNITANQQTITSTGVNQ